MSRTESPEILSLASKYPKQLILTKGDVAKDEDNKSTVELAIKSYGKLDSVILNAGTLDPLGVTSSFTGNIDSIRKLFDVNFFSLISMLTYAIPYLNSVENKSISTNGTTGRIVLVSSGGKSLIL